LRILIVQSYCFFVTLFFISQFIFYIIKIKSKKKSKFKKNFFFRSCTDLNDSDVEISIIRGINYSREADTYVICEFPFPSDNHPINRTSTIKDSANPEYQAVFLLNGINRASRQCQRAFKRHALKCEIWAKG